MFGGGFLSYEYRIINNSTISRGLRKTYKQKNIRVSSHYVCVYDSVLSLDFSPSLFIWSVSVGCQFGAIYHREPVAITNMCFFSGQKTCTQIQIMHFETNHKMQMLDCYSLQSDRENALK